MAVLLGVAIFSALWMLFCNLVVYSLNENSPLARRLAFRGFFATTNRLQPAKTPPDRPQTTFAWDVLDPNHLVTSACPLVETKHILLYRVFVLLCFVAGVVLQGLWGIRLSPEWLSFFTNWTFIAMAAYAVLGIGVCLQGKRDVSDYSWRPLDKLFMLVYVSACVNGIFLTIFYWVVLYTGGDILPDNLFRHGLNGFLMLGELFVSRVPICTYHAQAPALFVSVYGVFFYTYYAFSGKWQYGKLSWEEVLTIVYLVAIPFTEAASLLLMYICASVRESLLSAFIKKEIAAHSACAKEIDTLA